MRLVDADRMIYMLERAVREKTWSDKMRVVILTFEKMINDVPTEENAVVPVRCKDCLDLKGGYCVGFGENGYCSDGRTGEGRRKPRC